MVAKRHNVFVSYHHNQDQAHKTRFERLMRSKIVDMSVNLGDIIGENQPTEAVLQQIREDHIARVSVTVVLIGRCTWKRKYVDWEIGASLRDTPTNPRCGLIGILLPDHPDFGERGYRRNLLPPRLVDNLNGENSFAAVYDWSNDADAVQGWIHKAFSRRRRQPDPDIGRHPFADNWRGTCAQGWS